MRYKNYISYCVGLFLISAFAYAGNQDRVGEAGASELKINPWASSSGLAGANSASIVGIDAAYLNVAGLAFTNSTEVAFGYKDWLSGSGIGFSTLGLGQRVGESSVFGLTISAMTFGQIDITTVNLPDGGAGTYSPTFLNIGLSYAKAFSNSIYGGITLRSVSEQIANSSASGLSLDVGIRYVTGKFDKTKFGISLKNIGPKMKFSGDGFSEKVIFNDIEYTLKQRSQGFELPALLNIGIAHDFHLGTAIVKDSTKKDSEKAKPANILTANLNFLSNSFGKDQVIAGLEYAYKNIFKLRVGYAYENGSSFDQNASDLTNAYMGPAGGIGFNIPLGKADRYLGIDYAFRPTVRFSGTHSASLRINL